MYLIRLDDASDYMDVNKWNRMEKILDKYQIKPIVGIIPENKDKELLKYKCCDNFIKIVDRWYKKGWTIAMHGYQHVYVTNCGGINPVNNRSEFAGLTLKEQKEKIRKGFKILVENNIQPKLFFAPSHTFDKNTIKALKDESTIKIISDTIANDIYYENGMYFIPQQSGSVRKLPFKISTFCYHPNTMKEEDYIKLENFIVEHKREFGSFDKVKLFKRKKSIYDKMISVLYFLKIKLRRVFHG